MAEGVRGLTQHRSRRAAAVAYEGLLSSVRNAGYSVRTLSAADVPRHLRCAARDRGWRGAAQCIGTDEQLERIADAVSLTERYLRDGDWSKVGTASLGFHRTVVELAASPRLNRFFATVAAQLRLAFAVIQTNGRSSSNGCRATGPSATSSSQAPASKR